MPYDKPTTKQLKETLTNYSPPDLLEDIFQSFITHPKFSDIEYVLQSVREIVNFSKNKGGLYFFEQGKNGIFRYKHGEVPFDTFNKLVSKVETKIEDKIFENYRWNRDSNNALLKIYDKIFNFLRASDEIHVFTTNYDKAVEQYCNLRKDLYVCIDGFERNPPYNEFAKWTGNFNKITLSNKENIFLYKLHGSLNWKEHVDEGLVRTNEESKPDDPNYIKNVVIYPTLTPKEEEDTEPHRSVIEKFKNYMKGADCCIIIGYSFRDYLNIVFNEFVQKGKTLIVISPSAISNFRTNILKERPTEKELEAWKKITSQSIQKTDASRPNNPNVYLIQKKLAVDSVEEIIKLVANVMISTSKTVIAK